MPEQTPASFTLQAPVDLAAEAAAGKRPRFTIHAYHGGAMRVDGFYRPVVIDLAGLRAGDRVPILLDHDRKQIVGQADDVSIDAKGIRLAGSITGEDEPAQKVLTHAKNGFVWAASVGVGVEKVESLSEEQSAKVNGRSVTGPVYVIRAGRLSEVSLLPSGADEKARADIKAQKTENQVMPQTTEPKTDPPVDPIQAERERIDAVSAALKDWPDLAASAVNEGWAPEKAREAALLRLRASRPRAPMPEAGGPGAESADVLQAAVALKLWPAHAEKVFGATACQKAADLRCRHIMDIAAAAVTTEQGHAPSSQNELLRTAFAPRRMQASFSTLSMPQALTEGAQRVALELFKTAPKTWDRLVKRVAVKDFREHKPVGLDGRNGQFEEVAPDGELKHGVLLERGYSLQARTVGKMLTITRRDIINDDLGLFADLPEWLASNAARRISDDIYRLLLANDGFFSEANGNYLEGADTVLGIDGLSAAVQLLRNQTDGDGRILDFAPATLLVGPALESVARMLLNSTTLARYVADGTDLRPEANPFKGLAELAVEPRLESESFPGASAKKWHLFSAGENGAILLGLLNGIESPIIETGDADFSVLGMQIRAYLDFGVALGEPKAAVMSLGEAE